jgi:hypothetical protein
MAIRPLRRALTLATIGLFAFAGTALADTVRGDARLDIDGVQGTRYLGEHAPSAEITVEVGFSLVCTVLQHPDAGQTITLELDSILVPADGAVVSATDAEIGPMPDAWPDDGSGCGSPVPSMTGTNSTVVLRAPSSAGSYTFSLFFAGTLSPAGNNDASALGLTQPAVDFTLDVVGNTAPSLSLPGDMTVEGDTTGGWTAAFIVGATDTEDDPDPVPTCSVAVGDVLPLGTTTVTCDVTDLGGLSDHGSFDVTVVDTTPPALTTVDVAVTTDDPTGASVSYPLPVATDVVYPQPSVVCSPASGSWFPVGTTTVSCTATDDSGNSAPGSFDVSVTYVAPHVASAVWGEPVGAADPFVANRGRTVPVKVVLLVDGLERTSGDASLAITGCGEATPTATLPMTWSGGRWNVSLDTAVLAGSCYRVAAWIDGLEAGSFRLDLVPSSGATAKRGAR